MPACGHARPVTRLLTAESGTVHAVNPVVSVVDFANRGRAYSLRVTQRHQQPVAVGQLVVNIAESVLSRRANSASVSTRRSPNSVLWGLSLARRVP
jgi:hypothetical protein